MEQVKNKNNFNKTRDDNNIFSGMKRVATENKHERNIQSNG